MTYRVPRSRLTPIEEQHSSQKITGEGIPNIIDKYGEDNRDKAAIELMTKYHTNFDKAHNATEAYGPGWWDTIHRKAASIESKKDLDEFVAHMDFVARAYPCQVCRVHYHDMWQRYKTRIPMFYLHMNAKKKHYGMFLMTWQMHNEVNERLHKPKLGWADAVYIYYAADKLNPETGEPCDEACDGVI